MNTIGTGHLKETAMELKQTHSSTPFPHLLSATLALGASLILASCGAPQESAEAPKPPALEPAPPAPAEPPTAPSKTTPEPAKPDPVVTSPAAPKPKPIPEPPAAEPKPAPKAEPKPVPAKPKPIPEPPATEPKPAPKVEPKPVVTTPPANTEPDSGTRSLSRPPAPPKGKGTIKMRGVGTNTDTPPLEASKDFHTVDVFYGTDRQPTGSKTNNDRYGPERHRDGPMEYGKTTISIPRHHKIGVVERPKWYKLEFSEDPKKHVTISKFEKMDGKTFFSTVGKTANDKPKNEALLFIHGFNVSFDDAVRRTGQIAFDLDFGGVPLSYSWPSQASLKAYTVDEANAEWSIPHLTQFLIDLQEKTEIDKIHVIAHSMGTRVLSYALANAKDEGFDLDLNNVILAAPDIDVDIFKDQILPKITQSSDKLTMYASSDDTALKLSQSIHGNGRLGLSGSHILVTPGMDTINASGIDTSMLGHGYYGSHKVVVTDIFNLVIKGLEPPKRKLILGELGQWDFGIPKN